MANFDDQGVIDALNNIAEALNNVAIQIKYLGNGGAATDQGAIEAHGYHMGEKVDSVSRAIAEGFNELAHAIRDAENS